MPLSSTVDSPVKFISLFYWHWKPRQTHRDEAELGQPTLRTPLDAAAAPKCPAPVSLSPVLTNCFWASSQSTDLLTRGFTNSLLFWRGTKCGYSVAPGPDSGQRPSTRLILTLCRVTLQHRLKCDPKLRRLPDSVPRNYYYIRGWTSSEKIIEKLHVLFKESKCSFFLILILLFLLYFCVIFFPGFSDVFWQCILISVLYSIQIHKVFVYKHLTHVSTQVFFERALNTHATSKPLKEWRKACLSNSDFKTFRRV